MTRLIRKSDLRRKRRTAIVTYAFYLTTVTLSWVAVDRSAFIAAERQFYGAAVIFGAIALLTALVWFSDSAQRYMAWRRLPNTPHHQRKLRKARIRACERHFDRHCWNPALRL